MPFYTFYQKVGGNTKWDIALASERQKIITEIHPELISVLDVNHSFQDDLSLEEAYALKYLGPAYADFDTREGETIADVIPQIQAFLDKLKAAHVNLDSLRLFATGGKGFHVEMPLETIKEKVPPSGITLLPYILKEFMFNLVVDTMDFRVYTAKRGRMWRCPNVKRSNDHYKVPVTVAEIYEMTAQSYDELTSSPRPAPPVAPPTLSSKLAVLFSMAEEKVLAGVKKRKGNKTNVELVKRFKGEWPATLTALMNGDNIADGAGFNKIAMQLAIAAHALGKSESDFMASCNGLIEKHHGDGKRYNTPTSRRNELLDKFHYMDGNPCYEFAVGPIKSILTKDTKANDLEPGDALPDDDDSTVEDSEAEIGSGVRISPGGMFVRTEFGWKKCSDVGLGKPSQLIDLDAGNVIGYELEFFVEGKTKGIQSLTMNHLQSKQALQAWTSHIGSASVQANDSQVSALQDILRRKADAAGTPVMVIRREGLDLVLPLGAKDPLKDSDIVWAHIDGVSSRKGLSYKQIGATVSEKQFKSDLMYAPAFENTEGMRTYIQKLLRINTQEVVAKVVGWFFAAFLCQPIRRLNNRQFPTLHPYGESGAGKSSTIHLMAYLHYYLHTPVTYQASSGTSIFTMSTSACQSGSIPVILEEVKTTIDPKRMKLIEDIAKNNYTGEMVGRGSVRRETGKSDLGITSSPNVAPLVIVGEQMLTTTALLERFVVVPFEKASRSRYKLYKDNYKFVSDIRNSGHLGTIGKHASLLILNNLNLEKLAADMRGCIDRVTERVGDVEGADRPIYNLAVTLMGLQLARETIGSVFGEEFDGDFNALEEALLVMPERATLKTVSEATKVLDILGMLTSGRTGDPSTELVRNQDYTISSDGKFLDISLKYAYVKYMRWCRSVNQQPLYNDIASFVNAMRHYSGTVTTNCSDNSLLCKGSGDMVFRFSMEILAAEGVEMFS